MAEIVSFRKDNNNSGEGALVLRQLSGGILRLTLNNPPANALSISVMETLMGELQGAADDQDVRIVVIASTGFVLATFTAW